MATDSASSDHGGHKFFSGNDEDPKEYRRWKAWVSSKLLTMSTKMPAEARGAFIYTLLTGKALEAVEHLDSEKFHKEGGDKVLLSLLDKRFPDKDASDEMSENLTDIFNLRAHEGESLKGWISRASEAFDKLNRKTNVEFPEEARGWVILHRSGLTPEQQAVVLARSLGVMKREEIGRAMRSCYPEFTCPRRKQYGLSLVEDEQLQDDSPVDNQEEFEDVEQFLAEHSLAGDAEVYDEPDVAEALAVTWKERRQDLNRLQKARRFHDASNMKRQFRIEVQELKKKTRCHRCNQIGHWSRECPKGKGKGSSSSSTGKGVNKGDSGAAAVEHFVAAVSCSPGRRCVSLLDEVRERLREKDHLVIHEQFLVSSPGYGILDSGCGRSIIGRATFEEFKELWKSRGASCPETFAETNHFRFGNGAKETSTEAVRIPVVIAGRPGTIHTSLVQGKAPLLISRNALRALSAKIDFSANEMRVFPEELIVPLETNSAGQYVIQLLGEAQPACEPFAEIMMSQDVHDTEPQSSAEPEPKSSADGDSASALPSAAETAVGPASDPSHSVWSRVDRNLRWAPLSGKQGPYWHQVIRRVVTDLDTNEIILDQPIDPKADKREYMTHLPRTTHRVQTDLWFRPQEKPCPTE